MINLKLSSAKPAYCPQCGEEWSSFRRLPDAASKNEYCPGCGVPTAHFHRYDPWSVATMNTRTMSIDSGARLVVRAGVAALGIMGLLTGCLLIYGGWVSPDNMDAIQVWVSRLGGPVLLIQGFFYARAPFRRPEGAKIIPFPQKNRPR